MRPLCSKILKNKLEEVEDGLTLFGEVITIEARAPCVLLLFVIVLLTCCNEEDEEGVKIEEGLLLSLLLL